MLITSLIRNVPDYPVKGIMFKDITTLLKDAEGFKFTINEFANRYRGMQIDKIAGIESRGFIFGAALAFELGLGFVPVRKKGKLPAETIGHDYELEYGTDRIEMHVDAVSQGEKVLLVDDLIATGGTAGAAIKLIEKMGGTIVEACFVVDLPFLGGSVGIIKNGHTVFSLCEYDNEHE
jgi:adenine phosphoribosyltransferase